MLRILAGIEHTKILNLSVRIKDATAKKIFGGD